MPISTSSFGDERDQTYQEYQSQEQYDEESLDFPGLTPPQAETYLKRLGGGSAVPAGRFERLRGTATTRLSTDEIMALTRGEAA